MLLFTETDREIQIEIEEICQNLVIHQQNFQELKDSVEERENPSDLIGNLCKLHNYLASYFTLKEKAESFTTKIEEEKLEDQTVESLEETSFMEKYAEKLEEHNFLSRGAFIEDLRNYTQHDRLPLVRGGTTFETSTETISGSPADLDKKRLLENQGAWSQNSKEFLERNGDRINLMAVVEDQQDELEAFYDWLFETVDNQVSVEISGIWEAYDGLDL